MSSSDLDAPSPAPGGTPLWLKPVDQARDGDRRAHERLMVHELEWLKSIRLRGGPVVSLIDLSVGGALIETTVALRPGSAVSLTITGTSAVETVSLRVLRCEVTTLDDRGLVYRGACLFDRPLALPGFPEWSLRASDPTQDRAVPTSEAAVLEIAEALRTLHAAAARAGGATPDAPLVVLLADIGAALGRGEPPRAVLALFEKHRGTLTREGGPNASDLPLVARGEGSPPIEAGGEESRPAPGPASDGCNRLVVKYLDGRLIKGVSRDFHPSRQHFHLAPAIDGGASQIILVPVAQLKAVFFVRDLSGDAAYVERKSFIEPLPGRRIEVTFLDDEIMVGATLSYRPDGSGFFITPADTNGNNLRVFIGPSAVRHVRYL